LSVFHEVKIRKRRAPGPTPAIRNLPSNSPTVISIPSPALGQHGKSCYAPATIWSIHGSTSGSCVLARASCRPVICPMILLKPMAQWLAHRRKFC